MKNALKSITCSRSCSSASVVDGKLILSFPGALTPVVWQMDLAQAKASALEVRDGKDGQFTLTLKNPKADSIDIATFTKRDEAIAGLMAASRALSGAHGQIRAANEGTSAAPARNHAPARRGRWIPALLGVILLIVLIGVWGSLVPQLPASPENTAQGAQQAQQGGGTAGVPMSADDFLNRQ